MGNGILGDVAQAVVDFLVERELRSAKATSGKRLRAYCRSAGHDLATIESLLPTYAQHSGTAPDDEYEVTFAGLRASSRAAEVEAACQGVVVFLRAKFTSDPDLRSFSSRELAASAPGPADLTESLSFFRTLIRVTGLAKVGGWGSGNPETYHWVVPPDIERLIAVQTIEEFEKYLTARVPPTRTMPEPGPAPTAYDVTLSFAGEDRAHAEALAHRLRAADVKVFYDLYEQANLWGRDLYEHLHKVYSEEATFCVIFVSRHYATKLWTTHERKAAQERALKERGGEYILPIRVDETRLPGLPDTIGYVGIEDGIDRIAEMFIEKLRARSTGPVLRRAEADAEREAFLKVDDRRAPSRTRRRGRARRSASCHG